MVQFVAVGNGRFVNLALVEEARVSRKGAEVTLFYPDGVKETYEGVAAGNLVEAITGARFFKSASTATVPRDESDMESVISDEGRR